MVEKTKQPRYSGYKQSGETWLGMVPAHWTVDRLKWTVDGCFNGIWGEESNGVNDLIVVRVADFARDTRAVLLENPTRRAIPLSMRNNRLLRCGDLLLEKSGGGENQPVGTVVIYDHDEPAVCSNFVARMPVRPGFSPRFLMYLHQAAYAHRLNARSIKQTTGIQNLDSTGYLNERAAWPPLDEQLAIAKYLDCETANIDLLITKQERLIDLLTEKRQSIFSKLFTQGVSKDADTKDSGVGWLGLIPSHWKVIPIGALASFISYGFTNPMPTADDGPYMLTANDIGDGQIGLSSARRTTEDAYAKLTGKSRPILNDVLITKDGTLGRVALHSGEKVCINQSVALVRFKPDMVLPAFAANALRGGLYQARMVFEAGGTTIKHIYISRLSKMPLAVPPLDEQLEILKRLEQEIGVIESLMKKSVRAIELLREHRASLISGVVTGKIDVRGLA